MIELISQVYNNLPTVIRERFIIQIYKTEHASVFLQFKKNHEIIVKWKCKLGELGHTDFLTLNSNFYLKENKELSKY